MTGNTVPDLMSLVSNCIGWMDMYWYGDNLMNPWNQHVNRELFNLVEPLWFLLWSVCSWLDMGPLIRLETTLTGTGPTCLTWVDRNDVPTHRASSRQLFSHHCLKRTLFQIGVPSIFEKENIARPKPFDANALARWVMVSSSFMTILILLTKLKNCFKSSSGKSQAIPHMPRFDTQSGFQTLIWNKVLFKK
ncbi:hypothetical protein AVEN_118022-1 [Araneus ventricosus]|uniref:Uncharacterized protein n=1 Tax=Araneus ventricosus TaxID=182803 RepID=A0A4Y2C9E7_ARAVE|nr:hypothetical protein AVEN_118022-1 [Araneus ventricosus]